jgi:hypothetical protein
VDDVIEEKRMSKGISFSKGKKEPRREKSRSKEEEGNEKRWKNDRERGVYITEEIPVWEGAVR